MGEFIKPVDYGYENREGGPNLTNFEDDSVYSPAQSVNLGIGDEVEKIEFPEMVEVREAGEHRIIDPPSEVDNYPFSKRLERTKSILDLESFLDDPH